MQRRNIIAITCAAVIAGMFGVAHAAGDPPLDPATMSALEKMGAYLRSLGAFQVIAVTTDEDVLDDGQKVQYAGTATVLAHKPDRLRAEISNDRRQRLFLYDGKTFTLFAQRAGFYATIPAPPTIMALVDKLDASYDFTVPLEDLFRWGTTGWDAGPIKSAIDVGESEIEGVTCEQYVIRQAGMDWQIWIQRGDFPLPRKIVITTTTDDARPQHTAVFAWNLAPSFNESAFKFDAPDGVERVVFPLSASSPSEAPKAAGATK